MASPPATTIASRAQPERRASPDRRENFGDRGYAPRVLDPRPGLALLVVLACNAGEPSGAGETTTDPGNTTASTGKPRRTRR